MTTVYKFLIDLYNFVGSFVIFCREKFTTFTPTCNSQLVTTYESTSNK